MHDDDSRFRRWGALVIASTLVPVLLCGVSIAAGPRANAATYTIGPPIDVRVVRLHTALSVSWSPPSGGGSIDGYIVTANNRVHGGEQCVADGTTNCVVAPLINKTRYGVRVQAAYKEVTDGGAVTWIPIGQESKTVRAAPTTAQDCTYVGTYANLQGCDLSGANLSSQDLDSADLEGTNLTDANLNGANLAVADLTDAVLNGTNLSSTFFNQTNLTGESFAGADLFNATLDNESMTGIDFAGSSAGEITFISVVFDQANLAGAELEDSHFDYSSFTDADFDNVDLTDASMGQDNLSGATFSGATVTGIDWTDTTCPDGTNSDASSPQTCDGHGD